MSGIEYKTVLEYFQKDPNLTPKPNIFVVGFPLDWCPYSALTNKTIQNIQPFKNSHHFEILPPQDKDKFKSSTNYQGTFPIIFLLEEDEKLGLIMTHIGGFSDLSKILDEKIKK